MKRLLPLMIAAGVLDACSPPGGKPTSDVSKVVVVPVLRPKVSQSETGFVLQSPIACTLGKDCFIQQYVDHDASPDYAFDYTCGHSVYEGHDGTDFRLPDKLAQARGVAVLAAAPGVVMAVRDGEADFDVGAFDRSKVNMDRACGNGVVIDHGKGWQTQYCHMRKGSVAVAKDQKVAAGAQLGLVGQSGDAAFVHLHLTVRHDNKPVDPFGTATACSANDAVTLWAPALRDQMAYAGREVLNAGFGGGPVGMDDIERGGVPAPTRGSPALTAYVRAINLSQGDTQSVTLYAPDGTTMATSEVPPLDRDKAQYQMFVGQKLTTGQWPAGRYRGVYRVSDQSGQIVLNREFSLTLK